MKSPLLFFLTAQLLAADPKGIIQRLDRFPGHGQFRATLHAEMIIAHPSKSKELAQEMRLDLGLRYENGELWTHRIGGDGELAESELREILDSCQLLRTWLSASPVVPVMSRDSDSLVYIVPPQIPTRLKHLWASEGHLGIWLAPDGTPRRALLVQRYKGRTQRIAPTEEMKLQVDYTFKPEGDHLVIARMDEDCMESEGYDIHRRHRLLELRK